MKDPALQKIIEDAKTAQFREKETKGMMDTIGSKLMEELKPSFDSLSSSLTDTISKAFKDLRVDVPKSDAPTVHVSVPDVHVPEFKIPEPKVTVNVAKPDAPVVNVPAPVVNFPDTMGLRPGNKPFPVIMMDQGGKPMQFPVGSMGAGGGRGDFFTIKDIQTSAGLSIIDNDGFVKVTGSFTASSANSSTQIIDSSAQPVSVANPLPVTLVGGGSATSATNIVDSSGVAYSGSNPLPTTASVTLTVATGQGDGASALRTIQAGDTVSSVYVNNAVDNGDSATALRVVIAGNSSSSMNITNASLPVTKSGTWAIDNPVDNGDSASALRVVVAGNSAASVSATQVGTWNIGTVTTVTGITNTIAAALVDSSGIQYSGTNAVPVSFASPVNQGDTASALRIVHAGDSAASVATQAQGLNETTAGVLRVTIMTDTAQSANIAAIGGNAPATGLNETTTGVLRVVQMTDTAASINIASIGGTAPATGLNETTAGVTRVTIMTDTAQSANVTAFNGNAPATGLNETTSGVLRVTIMTDTAQSANVTAFNGNAPATGLNETTTGVLRTVTMSDTASSSQSKLIAMTTLPTAAADAASTFQKSDKLGREVNRPINVRDLIATAYATLSNGTETTLATASAGQYLDLVYILASNTSTAAQQIDIRAVSGGNIIMSLQVPASGTTGVSLPVPIPQDATGNAWTADNTDVTNSTVYISALFSKES